MKSSCLHQQKSNRFPAVKKLLVVIVAIAAMSGFGSGQKTGISKKPDKLVLGEDEVRQLLLLMDTDKNGKVSKAEFIKFMEAEFNRLDKDKSGELDVKELKRLEKSWETVRANVGK